MNVLNCKFKVLKGTMSKLKCIKFWNKIQSYLIWHAQSVLCLISGKKQKTNPIHFILLTTPSNICLFAIDNTFLLNNSLALIRDTQWDKNKKNKIMTEKWSLIYLPIDIPTKPIHFHSNWCTKYSSNFILKSNWVKTLKSANIERRHSIVQIMLGKSEVY